MDDPGEEIERLYRNAFVGFRNAVATVTGDYESARDAVQEGFARAFRSRGRFRGEGSLEGWVWRIVLRTALEQRRKDSPVPLGEVEADLVEPDRDPALAEALLELPPKRRLMVFLRYFADLDYATIAEACEVEEGTVAATLAQARAALATILDEQGVRR
ncbi:MAG TPA: sigma-70 family RNA polymerase sigma factor [Gaiellaceae bacterium]|nr:sigma-70 family RNA polymerase sigma factor [Gaiellaceae bacterium]